METRLLLNRSIWLLAVVFFAYPLLFSVPPSFSQAPFYQSKVITVIQSREAGGSGDPRARAVTKFLQKYIPGNPTIVHEYMPGGGGLKAANHMYAVARPDGLTIGSVNATGMLGAAVFGGVGVKYDMQRFIYLGSPNGSAQSLFYTRKEIGISNLEKLRATSGIRIAAQAVGHNNYNIGRIVAYLVGLKEPKFVTGYSTPEMDAALLRGEVDGRVNEADSMVRRNPDWIEKDLMDFHLILEIPKGDRHPRFSHLPELESFAKTEKERQVVALQRAFRVLGSPFVLPPGTPKEVVAILQGAMRKAFQDPEFPKEFQKMVGDPPEVVMPEVLEKSIKELPQDPEVVELLKKLAGPGPVPPR